MFDRCEPGTANCELRTPTELLAIQRLDLLPPAFFDHLALDLEGWRQLPGVDAEFSRQQGDPFDPLVLREFAIERIDDLLVKGDDVGPRDQLFTRARRPAKIFESPFERLELVYDQGCGVLPAIAEEHGFGDDRAALEDRFDRLRCDLFAAGSDQQILLAVGDRQVALRIDVSDVTGVKPTTLERGRGRLRFVEVPLHDVRPAREDLSVLRNAQLDALDRPSDGANTRRVQRIEGENRPRFGQSIALDDRNADGVKELHHVGTERRTA